MNFIAGLWSGFVTGLTYYIIVPFSRVKYGEDHPFEAGWLFGFLGGFATLIAGCMYLLVRVFNG